MFTKSDQTFERAVFSPADRLALLQKLKRRRSIAFWSGIAALCSAIILALIALIRLMVSEYKYIEQLEIIIDILLVLLPVCVGLIIGSVFLNQDVKMVILSASNETNATESGAEQVTAGDP